MPVQIARFELGTLLVAIKERPAIGWGLTSVGLTVASGCGTGDGVVGFGARPDCASATVPKRIIRAQLSNPDRHCASALGRKDRDCPTEVFLLKSLDPKMSLCSY